jgi:hypothetical protein
MLASRRGVTARGTGTIFRVRMSRPHLEHRLQRPIHPLKRRARITTIADKPLGATGQLDQLHRGSIERRLLRGPAF